MKQIFTADNAGIGKATEFIRKTLDKGGIKGKANSKAVLEAEESMGELVAHVKEGSDLVVNAYSFFGTTTIELSAEGDELDIQKTLVPPVPDIWAAPDTKVSAALRQLILSNMSKELKYKHKDGVNTIQLSATRSSQGLFLTLGALISAIILGVLLKTAAPKDFVNALDANFLTLIKNMYMNALKVIAAPVVFFSIVGCFSHQTNPSGLGRIGAKIITLYLITTIIATIIGIGVFCIFRPGDPATAASLTQDVSALTSQAKDISVKDLITDIVPSNFIAPFLESNMLQLLFLAVLTGLAISLIGDYAASMSLWFEGCCELFLKIASIIMRTTPLAVFCSILSLVLKIGPASLFAVISMFGTFLFGLFIMIVAYCLILVISGFNPLLFFKRYLPTMLQVFSIASSNASISLNMEACKKELGISSDIYSLSIPLGATVNMDGTCVLLAVQALTIAEIYGVHVPGGALFGLALSIVLMSIGAPGVPGSCVIILSMLLEQIGVPVEGVAFVMGIGPLLGMFISMSNCLGDVVVTTAVARSEKMIDLNVYQRK